MPPQANVSLVSDVFFDAYAELHISEQVPRLQLGMFCDPRGPHQHFPILSGTKCAVNRHIVPALRILCVEFNDGSPRDQLRLRMVSALESYYNILARYPAKDFPQLPDQAVLKLRRSIDKFLVCYWKLAYQALSMGLYQWNIVPKFHYFWHIGYQACFLHPDLFHNYGDEDFMGKIKLICASCIHGLAPDKLGPSVVEKYVCVLCVRWYTGEA